jgi:hypothetical protein
MEMSLLTDCIFENTDLQIETLAENFGISSVKFNGKIRDGLADNPHKIFGPKNLEQWLKRSTAHPIQKLSVEYFLEDTLIEGSRNIDAILDLRSWLPKFRTAGSFVVVLAQLVEFLIWLYDHEKLPLHTLVCFHSLTDSLLRALGEESSNRQALAGIGGVHLSLARVVDPYLVILEELTSSPQMEERLLVEGPGDIRYYEKALARLLAPGDVAIKEVRPHNSPWEILFAFGAVTSKLLFLALVLSTRTKLELARVVKTAEVKSTKSSTALARRRISEKVPMTEPIISLDFGGSRVTHVTPNLRLRAET